MLFAAYALFKADAEPGRDRLHEQFGGHLEQPLLRIHLAGALCDEAGARRGVLMLLDAPDFAAARAFAASSPYAPLYQRVDLYEAKLEVGGLG